MTGDSEAELAARVLKAEHELYPLALRLVAEGKASMVNGTTRFSDLTEMRAQTLLAPNPVAGVLDLEELARITP
jgi:hypothetical protein